MLRTERISINTDLLQGTEARIPIGKKNESDFLLSKPKNWPPFKPILRHSIKEDIPRELQTVMRFALSHCFFVVFVLALNFLTACVAYYAPYGYYIEGATIPTNLALSAVWMLLWSVLLFVFYSRLYKAIAHRRKGHYRVFVSGTVAGAVLAVLAVAGVPYTGLYGFMIGLTLGEASPIIGLSFTVAVLFGLDFFYLFSSLIVIHMKYSAFCKTGPAPVADDVEASGRVGDVNDILPSEINGRKITYFPVGAEEQRRRKLRTEVLSALPANSFTVIDKWEKVEGVNGEKGAFVLYVENDRERPYWSDDHVAWIINSGRVDTSTQVLTISRLENGKFVFGVANKK